ncbi:aminoacyltransferase [Streptococcus loxodontisalivarius]|uniref:Aminoacyltransferase FemA n=1 Tax=Streptococcus loxodontisalivarius TaxID=1349415 RepID=A0ABS2PTT7_9STRE|nr:aminoacyltransferase [Streptococcus loxodontisalivarius]MBM7642960.1 alanine adding enzyme [Streptococcus loxodontisalivarius]
MTLKELTKETYDQALQDMQIASFMQTAEMGTLLEKRGNQVTYLGLETDGKLQVLAVLYAQAMTGGLRMEINSGPASTDSKYLPDFYQALQSYAKSKGALELVVKPYDTYQTFDSDGNPNDDEKPHLITDFTKLGYSHDGLQTGYPGGEPDWHYVKDLTGLTAQSLRKSYSKKGRPLANKTATFGIKLRKLKRDELSQFKDITSSTSERRDYEDKPLDYYEAFYDSFGDKAEFMVASINFQDYLDNLTKDQDKLKERIDAIEAELAAGSNSCKKHNMLKELKHQFETFEVRKAEANDLLEQYGQEDVNLAASLFIYTPQEAVYLFSGSLTEFNKFYAPVALQEHVMLESIKRGINFYTFLGIQGIFDGSDGVLRFKQNFNGYIVRKMGTFHYYPRPVKYKLIQGLKKLLGR